MDLAQLKTVNNPEESRFELWIDNQLAKIDYKIGKSGNIYLIHTEVPAEIKNNGAANKIVREALEWVREQKMKMVPTCPFIKTFIKRNPEDYKDIIAEGVKL